MSKRRKADDEVPKVSATPKIKVEPGVETRIKVEPGLMAAVPAPAVQVPVAAQLAAAAGGVPGGPRKVVVLKSSMLKGLNQSLILNKNKFPKDQKTQTYSNSISDFPSTTSALLWYLEGEKKKASEAKRQNERFIGSMVPLLHPSVDDSELRTCLYTLRKIQDEMHREVNHLLEVISTLTPADEETGGSGGHADEEEPCSSSMALTTAMPLPLPGNSSSSMAKASNRATVTPSTSTSDADGSGVDIDLLDQIGAGICNEPDPSEFLAGKNNGDGGNEEQDESKDADEDEDEDEMDYEGSTQELLANVDCLLSTDGGSSQGPSKGGFRRAWDGMLSEEEVKRVFMGAKGGNVSKTHMRRRQISELLDAGVKASEIARIMDCGPNTIRCVVKMKKKGESLIPKYKGGAPRSVRTEEFFARMASLAAKNPDMSRRELAKKLGVSSTTVKRAMGKRD